MSEIIDLQENRAVVTSEKKDELRQVRIYASSACPRQKL